MEEWQIGEMFGDKLPRSSFGITVAFRRRTVGEVPAEFVKEATEGLSTFRACATVLICSHVGGI